MSFVIRLNSNKLKLLLAGLIGVFGLLFMQGTAHAVVPFTPPVPSRTLPESSDFTQGNNVWLTVANADNTRFLLDARTSVVRIYSGSPRVKLTINNGGHCIGNGPDDGAVEGEARTRFEFIKMRAVATNPPYDFKTAPFVEAGDAFPDRYSEQLSCATTTYELINDTTSADQPGYIQNGKYAFEIRATWLTGTAGWNQFKYSIDFGRLSYYAGSGDRFALKAANSACSPYIYPGCAGNFWMGFAANCDLKIGDPEPTVRLRWFDADAGERNQGGAGSNPVQTAIIEYNARNERTGNAVPIFNITNTSTGGSGGSYAGPGTLNITTGNGEGGYADMRLKPHHKYAWVWYGIRTANGIQFQLPTDGYNTLINFNQDCDEPTGPRATCTATPTRSPYVGETVQVKVKVTNASGLGGPIFNTNYQVRQISPGGQVKNLSRSLSPGQRDDGIPLFNISARPPPGPTTDRFIYQLFDGSGTAIPSTCQTDITWRARGTGGGDISADCSSTRVIGVSSPATWHPTPASYVGPRPAPATIPPRQATPVRIDKVPVAIRITEVGNPSNTFTRIINNGVDNGGDSAPISTYDLWSGMWLHKSYQLDLFVQGASGGDSLRYNNDGFWNPANNADDPDRYYNIPSTPTDSTIVRNCMEVECGDPGGADAEPGQRVQLNYGVRVTNLSQRTYSSNSGGGYHFTADRSEGIVNISGVSASPDIIPGDLVPINVSFSARIDFTGQFWINMHFQGGLLTIPGFSGTCPPGEETPASRPYFEVRAGDLSTGGGFGRPGDGQCSPTAPGYISPATGYNATSGRYDYAGGIRAYGTPNALRGSEAEFGAYSLGLTIGRLDGPIGFFSGHGQLFSNYGVPDAPSGGNLGGYLSPSGVSAAHCVNDFFTKTRLPNTSPSTFSGSTITGLANRQYEFTGDLNLDGSTIAQGQRVTLYVTGNVTIRDNIRYASTWDPTNRANIPFFALIVKGNITLSSGVSQLDGLYVAQPSNDFNGIFSTCDAFCPNQLIVNGGVIAQEVHLNRAHGTVGPLEADVNGLTEQPGEIFRYVPSMVIGLPNFSTNLNSLESVFSLPPVF